MERVWQAVGPVVGAASAKVTQYGAGPARVIIGSFSGTTRKLVDVGRSGAQYWDTFLDTVTHELDEIERSRADQQLPAPPLRQPAVVRGTERYTAKDLNDDVCRVFKNGVDTDVWKAKIAAAMRYEMHWPGDKHEHECFDAYQKHLAGVLQALTPIDTTHKYTPHAVHNRRLMLNVKPEMVEILVPAPETGVMEKKRVRNIAFRVKGTTDILVDASEPGAPNPVFTSENKEVSPRSFGNVPLVIQVKKSGRNGIPMYEKCVSQSILELIATGMKSNVPVLAVLTDLRDDWTFLWFTLIDGTQRCNDIHFTNREEALTALASYLKSAEEDKLMREFNLKKSKDLGVKMTGAAFALPDEAHPRTELSEEDKQE